MYPSALQFSPFSNTLIQCVVRVHNWNGFANTVIIQEDDETFYAKQKERLQKAHPELTLGEVEKIILLQQRLADNIFDIWLTKLNKKIA